MLLCQGKNSWTSAVCGPGKRDKKAVTGEQFRCELEHEHVAILIKANRITRERKIVGDCLAIIRFR